MHVPVFMVGDGGGLRQSTVIPGSQKSVRAKYARVYDDYPIALCFVNIDLHNVLTHVRLSIIHECVLYFRSIIVLNMFIFVIFV